MSYQNVVILGLVFGIISTMCVHLGKAMERQGIEIYSKDKSFKEKGKKPLIYIFGLIIHNSFIIWQIIALQFSSAAVFASVFGLGLILLMLYSHFILHEEVKRPEIIGSILIIIGTTSIGFIQLIEPPPAENVIFLNVYILLLIITVLFSILVFLSFKKKYGIAIIFGIVTGIITGLDNIFKRIGLKGGIANITNPQTLPLFILSFIMSFTAFFLCQIAFKKDADASKLVPIYNSFYIAFPVMVGFLIYEANVISLPKIIALLVIVTGVFLMQFFKSNKD